jgi:hypothetical protein
MRFAALALLSALSGLLAAQGPAHSVARINDPLSHGQVGDGKLSLVEGLLLNMRLLNENQLSVEERAQLGGFGTDIAILDIDATVVPLITFERDLPLILDTPHGVAISGSRGRPTLDLGATKGFLAASEFFDLRNLTVRGGSTAVTVLQSDSFYGSVFDNVVFTGQGSTAVKFVMSQDAGFGRFQVTACKFDNVPVALDVESGSVGRDDLVIVEDSRFVGGQTGLALRIGATGKLEVILDRNDVSGTAAAFAFTRAHAFADRAVQLDATHNRIAGGAVGFSFAGFPGSATRVTLRMADFAASQHTVQIGPLGADAEISLEDSRLSGNVELLGGATKALLLGNARLGNASLTVGSTGGAVRVVDSILDTVATSTVGAAAVTIAGSRFVQGSVQGAAAAPVSVQGSHLGGVSVGANVSVTGALAAPQLGSMEVAPLDPQIGTSMRWSVDLPAQLSGVWLLGMTARRPLFGPPPLHLYFDPYVHVSLPWVMRAQAFLTVPVPLDTSLIGGDLTLQLAVVPDPGFAAPWLSLPPGRRFVIR